MQMVVLTAYMFAPGVGYKVFTETSVISAFFGKQTVCIPFTSQVVAYIPVPESGIILCHSIGGAGVVVCLIK